MHTDESLFDTIIKEAGAYLGAQEIGTLQSAFSVAEDACAGGPPASGLAPLRQAQEAALVLVRLEAKAKSIAAALLAGCPQETCSISTITEQVDQACAVLVDDVRHMRDMPYLGSPNRHSWAAKHRAGVYRAFVASLQAPDAILVELAHQVIRLRNLSSFFSPEQRQIVADALEIYSPLAHRLGIWRIKWEIEDRAFRFQDPDRYYEIAAALDEQRASRETSVKEIVDSLDQQLTTNGINASISGRPKHIYSIYRKMQRKGVPLDAIYDIRAVRVIVDDIETCYLVLGIVHDMWRPIPDQFDDYIAAKKSNGYRSLHTAVIDSQGKTLEIQIRTHEMHREAELGIAAHWRYKESRGSRVAGRKMRDRETEQMIGDRISWLRSLMDVPLDEIQGPVFQHELQQKLIYVSTPMGDAIQLPTGATPIDFAYRIHTELGHRCYRAKVNGKIVALDHPLSSGDIVEIITKDRGGPSFAWLSREAGFIQTREARKKINAWFRRQRRQENAARGHDILDRELAKQGLKSSRSFDQVAQLLNLDSTDEMLVQIGSGSLSIDKLRSVLAGQERISKEERAIEAQEVLLTDREQEKTLVDRPVETGALPTPPASGLQVAEMDGLYSRLAKCCNPVPPEPIVAYVTRGHGATIHLADCPNVTSAADSDRLVPASWGEEVLGRVFPVTVIVEAINRKGLLADISAAVAMESIDINSAIAKKRSHWATIEIELEVTNAAQLGRALGKIAQANGVRTVYRKKG